MKNLIMIGLLFSSISALAAESYYDRTKTMFDQGSLPTTSDLLGMNVGRCFLRDNPFSIQDGALFGRIDNTGAGPIDANTVVAIWAYRDSVGYYETTPVNKIDITHRALLPVRTSAESLLVDNKVDDNRQVVTAEVRKTGSYLVLRLGTYMYCYTFIKR